MSYQHLDEEINIEIPVINKDIEKDYEKKENQKDLIDVLIRNTKNENIKISINLSKIKFIIDLKKEVNIN
jgi:hypothetical protein